MVEGEGDPEDEPEELPLPLPLPWELDWGGGLEFELELVGWGLSLLDALVGGGGCWELDPDEEVGSWAVTRAMRVRITTSWKSRDTIPWPRILTTTTTTSVKDDERIPGA